MSRQWKRPDPAQRRKPPVATNQRTVPNDDARKVKASEPRTGARVERVIPLSDLSKLGSDVIKWRGVLIGIKSEPKRIPYGIVACDDGQTREIRATALRYENES